MKKELPTNVVKPNTIFFENEKEYEILEGETEIKLDNKIKEIESYIEDNDGKGKKESEKDELYKNAKDIWNEYAGVLREAKYSLFLNRKQYKFLSELITKKMEYDVNTVFFALELKELLDRMSEETSQFKSDKDLIGFKVDATEITYIYHLISKHKVKGLTKDSYLFAQVLMRIGDMSKILNYYDTSAKNLSKEIQDWAAKFDEKVKVEKVEAEEEY